MTIGKTAEYLVFPGENLAKGSVRRGGKPKLSHGIHQVNTWILAGKSGKYLVNTRYFLGKDQDLTWISPGIFQAAAEGVRLSLIHI